MFDYYIIFFILILACAGFGLAANRKIHNAYRAMDAMPTASRMTGYDTATKLLRAGDARDISVGRVRGTLSDHYHPTKKIVNLSENVYGTPSIAAAAIAAHEVGHVMQKKKGYLPYKLRTFLVPITNIGSRLALPLVLFGLLLDIFVGASQNGSLGFTLAIIGVALYGLSTLFTLVTLPVEYDASRRAKKMLLAEGVLTEEELPYAERVLSAAATTYVAALLTSLVYFLRFALWVLLLFGGNRRRR